MTKIFPAPKTVLESILDWSQDRPAWQRDALRRIVIGGRLAVQDYKELTDLCKQGRGAKDITLRPSPLQKNHLPANPGGNAEVSLISLADIKDANHLAPGQVLDFEKKGITIVYGDNGAGKSGYARILKRACRARYPGKIVPNVYAARTAARASAVFIYGVGGTPQAPENWKDADHPHTTLSAISVFDRECASVHIDEKNEVAFRPFGLDVPDEMATACQRVKDTLTAEQQALDKSRNPIFSKPPWKETTVVGETLNRLRYDTDYRQITSLGTLSELEQTRLARLREDLSKNPSKASAEQTLKADNLKRLLAELNRIKAGTTDEALASVRIVSTDAKSKREAAKLAAAKAFAGEPLKGIGGEVWRSLWDAARRYSSEVAYPGQPFPPGHAETHCLLCQQPVEAEARDRMARFEDFIQKDTDRQAQQVEAAVRSALDKLLALKIETRALKANLAELSIQNAALTTRARRFLAAARLRRRALFLALKDDRDLRLPNAAPDPRTEIGELESTIRKYAAELQKSATGEERKKLESELVELNDRELLSGMLQTVQEEIERLKGIQFLHDCAVDTTTNAITKIGNEIADSVITPALRDRFQEEIVKLAAHKVRVEIVRSGGKYGSPQYQVRLFAKPDAKVREILSEGEQTCVALAAFLTELATATHRSALIFDDPVSSLDHKWRSRVADRLIEEAATRQIVVFTHDLIFVNDLDDRAEKKKIPVRLFTVARGPAGAGVVSSGLPWKGGRVEDRIDKLEKTARAARKLYDDDKEDEYAREAAEIYADLRASWERALEDIVFSRVVLRHRDYIDAKNLKKVTVLTEADCEIFDQGFKRCCDVIDAHDPSKGRNAAPPSPDETEKDIKTLKDWVASLRERQKKVV